MKKIIFSLAAFCVISLTAQPILNSSILNHRSAYVMDIGKDEKIKIVSNRATGDMQLRFTATHAGKVTIKILNEAGEMVLKQTNVVSNSINNIRLKNALDLAEGMYSVHVFSMNESYTTSFIIWK